MNAKKGMLLIVFIIGVSLNVKSTRLSLLMNVSVMKRVGETSREFVKSVLWAPSNLKNDVRNAEKTVKSVTQILCALSAKMIIH